MLGSNHTRRKQIGYIFIKQLLSRFNLKREFPNNARIYSLNEIPISLFKANYHPKQNLKKKDFQDQEQGKCGDSLYLKDFCLIFYRCP